MTTPFPFVAAQVLTASELNSITNLPSSTKTVSYTLVAGDAGKRIVMNSASSTTITVNTSLFTAGDVVELSNINTGVCTVTAGTATVSSAGPLAIPQYGGGRLVFTSASAAIYFPSAVTVASGALTLIQTGSLSGASTTFSSAFSATYRNYFITINEMTCSAGNPDMYFTLGAAVTQYGYSQMYVDQARAWSFNQGSSSDSKIIMNNMGSAFTHTANIQIDQPFLATKTTLIGTGLNYQNSQWFQTAGNHQGSTSFTAFTISNSTGATMTGSVVIYGFGL
jgi:hypothetical protein